MDAILAALAAAFGIVIIAMVVQFIAINALVQCSDWSQPQCVGLDQFLNLYLDRFK